MSVSHCGADCGDLTGDTRLIDILRKAHSERLKCVQVYLGHKSKTSLKEKYKPTTAEINEIRTFLKDNDSRLYIHANLSLNFCRPPGSHMVSWMKDNLIYDLTLAYKLGAAGVILHTGSTVGKIEPHVAVENMVFNLQHIIDGMRKMPPLLMENMSGAGGRVVCGMREFFLFLNTLRNAVQVAKRPLVKACIDVAHAFLAGHDMANVGGMTEFLGTLDTANVALIHLNDAAGPMGSRRDIHAELGKGYLFKDHQVLKLVSDYAKKNKIPMLVEIAGQCKAARRGGDRSDTKPAIIRLFKELRAIYRERGDTFRAMAYDKALRHLNASKRPIITFADIAADESYTQIGEKSKDKIREIIESGGRLKLLERERSRAEKTAGLKDVIGIGPSQAEALAKHGATTVKQLKKMHENKTIKLTDMQRLGVKYHDMLKKPIAPADYKKAIAVIKRALRGEPFIEKIIPAGSIKYKGRDEPIGDIDLIIVAKSDEIDMGRFDKELAANGFMKRLETRLPLLDTFTMGKHNLMAVMKPSYHLDISVIPRPVLPFYQVHFSSGKEYSRNIKAVAKKQGYKLSQYGLFNRTTGKRIPGVKTVGDIMRKLGRAEDVKLFE